MTDPNNLSKITLAAERARIKAQISSLRQSMEALRNKESDFYEHHQHVVNTYNTLVAELDSAIVESEDIGKGV